jgi:hypothetical protein
VGARRLGRARGLLRQKVLESSGYRKVNPASIARFGTTRCEARTTLADSPIARRSATAGAAKIAGRESTFPSAAVKSPFVTTPGATALIGP